MATELKKQSIYVTLDSLLDTRLGTLAIHYPEIAKNVFNNNYYKREADQFENISLADFRALYKKRNVDTLMASMCTNAVVLLRNMVLELIKLKTAHPHIKEIEIVLNTHPYQLGAEERKMFGDVVRDWTGNLASVHVTQMPDELLTPYYCSENYDTMIMYDYEEFINIHHEALNKKPLLDVTLFVPALYFTKIPGIEDQDVLSELEKSDIKHPFIATEIVLNAFFNTKLMEIAMFSIIEVNELKAIFDKKTIHSDP